MSAFTPLKTERLRIRLFTPDDWRDVHAYTSDAAVMHYVEAHPMTEAQTRQFIAENMGDEAKHFAVELRAENRLIGHMAFHLWFGPRTYEIGWVLDPRYHGRGYATEAAAALLRYGFESLRLHRVIATCQPENPASWRVMEKIGMQREAHFRKSHLLHGERAYAPVEVRGGFGQPRCEKPPFELDSGLPVSCWPVPILGKAGHLLQAHPFSTIRSDWRISPFHGETWWDEYFYAMLEDDWFGNEAGKEIEENR